MIVKRGKKYVVKAKSSNRTLGTHDTESEALAQLRAIEASKARKRKGKGNPKPRY